SSRVAYRTGCVLSALETDVRCHALQHRDGPASRPSRPTPPAPFGVGSPRRRPSAQSPRWDNVPTSADPCVNPDHWESLSLEQFSDCPQCSVERRIGEQPRHVSDLSEEAFRRLPTWLQDWAEQAKAAQIA